MIPKNLLPLLFVLFIFTGCGVSNKNYNPNKNYSRVQLQQDFSLLRNILETKHPALYWYTPKDSMNFYFDSLYKNIADSMTELQFGWNILAPLTQKIRCGHTSFSMSKQWNKYIADKVIPSFPLHIKVWGPGDTMVVMANLNLKDSVIKKGTIITAINGLSNHELIAKMFQYLSLDGYAENVNYVRISSNFPFYHRNVFGLYKNYRVDYIDSAGNAKKVLLPMFTPNLDSLKKIKSPRGNGLTHHQLKKERIQSYRSLTIDTSTSTALITLNTFDNGEGRHLRPFIKKAFKDVEKQHLKNLILDLRSNGGGDINMSVLLTKFLRKSDFKVADSAYAIAGSLRPYTKYISKGLLSNIGLFFVTKKQSDGLSHFGYWERHIFHPRVKHHFNGKVFILTNGLTFSASTIFCNAVKGQKNIVLVGEETGGGWYGNSGFLIPDIILPVTKLRVRLPYFRIVQYNHIAQKGTGVIPDIFLAPTVEGVKKGLDRKMELVKDLIKNEK